MSVPPQYPRSTTAATSSHSSPRYYQPSLGSQPSATKRYSSPGTGSGSHGGTEALLSSGSYSPQATTDQDHVRRKEPNLIGGPTDLLVSFTSGPDADDDLHDATVDLKASRIDLRGVWNVLALVLIMFGILMLFAGYPLLDHFLHKEVRPLNLNSTGQVGTLPSVRELVDPDTPKEARTWQSQMDSLKYNLVFSDEFEEEGRTFWPGDDPFWEAVDLHYAATVDYEWYSPEAVNTTDGALQLTMTESTTGGFHNLNFQSGMVQSWNKVCFQGGYLEVAAQLPGREDTRGFWPGVWTMGNLARPGYLGSTEGLWPYSYSACDWGTLKNQTNPEGTAPAKALHANGAYSYQNEYRLSFLPGQRTSACTCPGEDHPGPNVRTSRSAPEVDVLEAQNSAGVGHASQSLQVAPFDADYWWRNQSASFWGGTEANDYTGGVYQEAVSGLAPIPDYAYIDAPNAKWVKYGVEIRPDWNHDGHGSITWYLDGKRTWHAPASVVPANPEANISRRIIPTEPLSIIMNYGISSGFQPVHFDELVFPNRMRIDYVRLYQEAGKKPKLNCDPADHPTKKYIEDHLDLYMNSNYSIFPREKYPWPKNRLIDQC